MDLMNSIMTESDWFELKLMLTEGQLLKSAHNIVDRSMNRLLHLEGKETKGKQQATYKAIGRRIALLRVNGVVGFTGKGTPVGNKSIKDCFGNK